MKLNYYPETDSLYIDLSSKPNKESKEISEGIVIDYDEDGHITGIDVDNASHKIDLKEIILNKVPAQIQSITVRFQNPRTSKLGSHPLRI